MSNRKLAKEASLYFGRNVSHQTVSNLIKRKDQILAHKTNPLLPESHIKSLERSLFEKRLVERLAQTYDLQSVTQAQIEKEALALAETMPEVKFKMGTKFKRAWARTFKKRLAQNQYSIPQGQT